MRALPTEVRYEEKRVKKISNSILNESILRKRIMSTLVRDYPTPSPDRARERCVC